MVNNLRLLCVKHNRYTAEKTYGEKKIKKHYIKESAVQYMRWVRSWSMISAPNRPVFPFSARCE